MSTEECVAESLIEFEPNTKNADTKHLGPQLLYANTTDACIADVVSDVVGKRLQRRKQAHYICI